MSALPEDEALSLRWLLPGQGCRVAVEDKSGCEQGDLRREDLRRGIEAERKDAGQDGAGGVSMA